MLCGVLDEEPDGVDFWMPLRDLMFNGDAFLETLRETPEESFDIVFDHMEDGGAEKVKSSLDFLDSSMPAAAHIFRWAQHVARVSKLENELVPLRESISRA